jgi:hypothetical protein
MRRSVSAFVFTLVAGMSAIAEERTPTIKAVFRCE